MNSKLHITASVEIPLSELRFRTSRSGGPGGQNVNKLETRVELLFDTANSSSLTSDQKELVLASLRGKIDAQGILHLSSQKSRSQWENKQVVIEKFVSVLHNALRIRRKRVKTTPTIASKGRRVSTKRKQSEKKKMRKVGMDDE